jgi:hypothetical protein
MLKPKKTVPQQPSTAKADSNLGKLASKHNSEPEDEEEQQAEQKPLLKKKGALASKPKSNLAAAFDQVPISGSARNITPGTHEGIIRKFLIQQPDAKGQSARIEYELCDPEFQGANQVTGWFKLLDADLKTPGGGMKPFKIALAKLGYEPENLEEAEACLQEITENNPGVLVKISYDENYPDYPRTRIESESDSEVVEAYRDNIPY